jgi:hypothetical protein
MWTVLADDDILNAFSQLRDGVPEASGLLLLRVLDIVAWRHGKRM